MKISEILIGDAVTGTANTVPTVMTDESTSSDDYEK